jgi:hypothetical protein
MIEDEKSDFETLSDFIKNADEKTLAVVRDVLENPEKHRTKELWSTGDECIFGKVVRDYGNLGEDIFPEKYVFLVKTTDNKYKIVIKSTPFDESVLTSHYDSFGMEEVQKLRHIFKDATKITVDNPLNKKNEKIIEC